MTTYKSKITHKDNIIGNMLKNKIEHKDNIVGRILTSKTTHKENVIRKNNFVYNKKG